jgi:hypothetical protein
VKHSETFKHSEPHKTPARLPWDSHYSRVNIERPDWKRRKLIGADLRVFWEYSDWLWCGWDWLTKSLCELRTFPIAISSKCEIWSLCPRHLSRQGALMFFRVLYLILGSKIVWLSLHLIAFLRFSRRSQMHRGRSQAWHLMTFSYVVLMACHTGRRDVMTSSSSSTI